jgi:hypothetical protein
MPVTDAIAQAKISRGTYYQLETKALAAMLRALMPGASDEDPTGHGKQIEALQAKIDKLEKDKRRLERLLQMTRKVLEPGPLTTGKGRLPKRSSARAGSSASPTSKRKKAISRPSTSSTPKPSADEP